MRLFNQCIDLLVTVLDDLILVINLIVGDYRLIKLGRELAIGDVGVVSISGMGDSGCCACSAAGCLKAAPERVVAMLACKRG